MSTYCGKSCEDCAHKAALQCPGCQEGPGRKHTGDCKLAKCCVSKGHQLCVTCNFSGNCGTLRDKHRMPEYRQKKIEADRQREAAIAKRAPFLGKWLWLLFWLFIPSGIFSVMANENTTVLLPAIHMPGLVLNTLCNVVYGVILLRLSTQEDRYRTAGICALVDVAVSVLLQFMPVESDTLALTALLLLPTIVISLVGEYNQFAAHATVLTDVDNVLSDKWLKLWKWNIGMYGALIGGLLLMLFIPVLGLLLGAATIIAAAIGIVVISILRLVYLYRTAQAFRQYRVKVM